MIHKHCTTIMDQQNTHVQQRTWYWQIHQHTQFQQQAMRRLLGLVCPHSHQYCVTMCVFVCCDDVMNNMHDVKKHTLSQQDGNSHCCTYVYANMWFCTLPTTQHPPTPHTLHLQPGAHQPARWMLVVTPPCETVVQRHGCVATDGFAHVAALPADHALQLQTAQHLQ